MKNINNLFGFKNLSDFAKVKAGILLIFPILVWLFSSCTKFVEVDLPKSQLTSEAVFEDKATANAALAGMYVKLRDIGLLNGHLSGLSCQLGLYADEFEYYGNLVNALSTNCFNNSLFAADPTVLDLWTKNYNHIYSANAIVEGVTRSTSLLETDRNQLKGEALFVRSFIHFYLLNIYGNIPYIKTTDYEKNKVLPRLPAAEVYYLIVADLKEAISLLPQNYITADRVRPNKATVYALLARVYLYMGLWPEADAAASAVINNSLYSWESNLDKIFLKGSTTTIWQFKPSSEGVNASEGSSFIFIAGPPSFVSLNPDFVNAFENNDQRKTRWIATVTNGTSVWYHAFKYKQKAVTGSSLEYSIVFRLAEQYLIRAEARAKKGELEEAKKDLNMIRNTAGLPNTTAVTADEIISAILKERRFELFTESGQRFFDLKRSGKLDTELPNSKPGWDHNDALWPIPALELNSNPNLLPQNPGY